MERIIYKDLLYWNESKSRKPLLLQGARQVGKSYILEQFGKKEFQNYHIFNFEKDAISSVFEQDLYPERIISELSIYSGIKINVNTDLVIFDEIQECPRALTSLKYFCEDMPELALCCAGSLLGVKLSSESYPVGKVNLLQLYPMNFEEFVIAINDDISLDFYINADKANRIPDVAHDRLWKLLKEYYVTGGMPQVVSTYISYRDDRLEAMNQARNIQKNLIDNYNKDFAKHSGKINSVHIVSVFENIPMQLSKYIDDSVKRYQFKDVIHGKKRYNDLKGPIDWLVQCGLAIKVKICNRSEFPLESYCKENIFKLFIFDIGLLGCMLDLPVNILYSQDYTTTKGYFAENFVAQEFTASSTAKLYSWSEKKAEIEFLRVIDDNIIPIEVKSGLKTQTKCLRQYILKYSPIRAIKITGNSLNKADSLIHNYPLYLAGKLSLIILFYISIVANL